jgi:hypothetical protein
LLAVLYSSIYLLKKCTVDDMTGPLLIARHPSRARISSQSGERKTVRTTGTDLANPNRTQAAIKWTVPIQTGRPHFIFTAIFHFKAFMLYKSARI